MNPNAKEFKFNASASSWTPAASTPAVAKNSCQSEVTMPPTPPPVSSNELTGADPVHGELTEDETIDETDPLWIATLKISLGDREKALGMLEDPDALMLHPEIREIMEKSEITSATDEDWEGMADSSTVSNTLAVRAEDGSGCGSKECVAASSKADTINNSTNVVPPASTPTGKDPIGEEEDVEQPEIVELVEGDPREHLNLVFIGHVDAGKSTLSGSILYLMGKVDARTIERFEREAKQRNRESWFLAFIMDTSEEERAKGKTVEVGRAHFETESQRYTILDAPGHKNYVPNMISGAAQADVGVLVISARKGEFETGFEKGGQTREHALLARTLGVSHLVVVINKMDDPTVMWDLDRYSECVAKLKPYLKQVGYVIKKDVKFVPISGLSGDNVLNEVDSSKCPWWKEHYTAGIHNTTTPTLIGTLDALQVSGRNSDGPLRMPCLDRYFERGCVVLGKVESGTIRAGEEVVIMPTRKKTKIDEVYIGEQKVLSAKPGENVMLKFNVNVEDIQKGYVICTAPRLCPAVREVKVQLALVDMLEHRPIFSPGYEAVMHVHTVEIEITCVRLLSVMVSGKSVARPYARSGQVCTARLSMPLSTCMETFDRMPALGRLTLRDEGKTIAVGKILELYRPVNAAGESGSSKK